MGLMYWDGTTDISQCTMCSKSFEGVIDWYQSQEPSGDANDEEAHDPDYVSEPIYPECIPLEDDHEFPAEEQPLPPIDSPTAESLGYVTESDLKEDPEEYEDDETRVVRDDTDDEDEEEEEEEHLALADSAIVVPVDEPVFPPERTEPVIPSPPLPPLPPSLYIPPPVDRRDDIPESEQPPRKRLYLSTIGSRYEIEESSTARPTKGRGIDYGFISTVDAEERRQGIRDVGYGIRDTWVDPAEAVLEIAPMTVGEVNTRVTELAELHERDTQDLYALLEDAQDGRSRISQRVDMDSQRVDLLMGDRMTLEETIWMVEDEAYASREAWAYSIELSQATHQEIQTHRDHVYAHETHLQAHQTQLQLQSTLIQTHHQVHETRFQMQQAELAALRETDRRRQDRMVETVRVIRDMRREMSDMQAELLALREQQRRARQPGLKARIPDHQDASGDADSHI
ncbi:hypothetical protein Tco_0083898 [Tanacetum coccineum]